MDQLADAVRNGASQEELKRAPVPADYLAAHLNAADVDMFRAVEDKDVRKSLQVGKVPMPELAPDEVLVAVMASAINYNTVWSAMFEPVPTFRFLGSYGRLGGFAARHDRPYQVVGSDAAGVVVRAGAGVSRWHVGDHVVVSCIQVDDHEPATHADAMLSEGQRAWGYETNFGGLAHYAVAKASQLIAKPAHLTWEEAGSTMLTASTSYRMLIGDKGARIKLGDVVLIWGATGGLGAFAAQLVRGAGGIAVGVVGTADKEAAARALGCQVVVNREEIGLTGADTPEQSSEQGKRLGRIIRREVGEDPHVAFDYVGRATFAISTFVVRRGGTVVTCGSSSGYQHYYDNRYLWMNSKRILGCHAANLLEQAETSRLFSLGRLNPVLSTVYPLAEVGDAARLVQRNRHLGKVGVLCLAEHEGLGVTDPALRARFGAQRLNPLRTVAEAR
ncbi:MAG TPA: crotonyl-CoA carboxylase/reductase [Amycolatopsis sp.]|nr:crotonyl-CoA carboxylase/reductase [Amycolatopsis sp.]